MTSVRAQILAALRTQLLAIDGTGKFHHDVAGGGGVQRWQQDGNDFQQLPTIALQWTDDVVAGEVASDPLGFESCQMQVVIDGILKHQAVGPSSDEQLEELLEDIERAVMADRTLAGLCEDIHRIRTVPATTLEGQPFLGGHVRFRISYHRQVANPELS